MPKSGAAAARCPRRLRERPALRSGTSVAGPAAINKRRPDRRRRSCEAWARGALLRLRSTVPRSTAHHPREDSASRTSGDLGCAFWTQRREQQLDSRCRRSRRVRGLPSDQRHERMREVWAAVLRAITPALWGGCPTPLEPAARPVRCWAGCGRYLGRSPTTSPRRWADATPSLPPHTSVRD